MAENKRSKAELIKEESGYLAGDIAAELADDNPYVSDASYELLKFHGSYQGYDRDTATKRKKAGLEKEWEFMLRMTCPGGELTPEQYLALEGIADDYANGTLKITTRQTFQFHCIVKENLKAHIKAINEQMLTTLGGCGDVVRNVMCSGAPYKDVKHLKLLEDTKRIARFCAPQTKAYEALWVTDADEVRQGGNPDDVEPLYGQFYMPRKFKIGLALPHDNSIDVLTHDLGIVPVYEDDVLRGYNIYVGGGFGMTHNKADTYPRLADPLVFVQPDDLLKAVEATIKLQRDHGDRGNRKHARLKYVVQENGLEWTRTTFEDYFDGVVEDVRPTPAFAVTDHMGWYEQGDGKWFLGVVIDSGRIVDTDDIQAKSALHDVIDHYHPSIRLTADQNIILADIEDADRVGIEKILTDAGLKMRGDLTDLHRFFLTCVALPTCGKALAEAERVTVPMINSFEALMDKHGIKDNKIAVRVTGCPNGCARPYAGDIGIVGRTPDHYSIYIGGDFEGTRLNEKILDRVPYGHLMDVFDVLFARYIKERTNDHEGFGDFAYRVGTKSLAMLVEEVHGAEHKWAKAV